MSYDELSHKIVNIEVESFEHLGRKGSEFTERLEASVSGGRDGGTMAKKGICKERRYR